MILKKVLAKTAVEEVILQALLMFLIFLKVVNILFTNAFPSSLSLNFDLRLKVVIIFSFAFFTVCAL